jgi:pyrroloquinoline quinone biosynthesis protein B
MDSFLRDNGPWSQLVALENIRLLPIQNATALRLNPRIQVTPLQVPHRDEFSETVGYLIEGPSKKLLFIPDIDKWQLWSEDIIEYIKLVDYAFLDGTFFANGEIDGRDMSQIPHPFIEESLLLFQDLSPQLKSRIFFIHFNHTNPVLKDDSKAYNHVIKAGFNIAREGDTLTL